MTVFNAAPFGGGILAGSTTRGPKYAYSEASGDLLEFIERLEALAAEWGIELAAAAVQFSLGDPRIHSTVVGMSSIARLESLPGLVVGGDPGRVLGGVPGARDPARLARRLVGGRPYFGRMVDYKLELIGLPVADLRSREASTATTLGWPVDHDQRGRREDPLRAGDAARLGVLDRVRPRHQRHGARLAEGAAGRRRVGRRGARRPHGARRRVQRDRRAALGHGSCTSATPTATRGRASSCPTGAPERNSLACMALTHLGRHAHLRRAPHPERDDGRAGAGCRAQPRGQGAGPGHPALVPRPRRHRRNPDHGDRHRPRPGARRGRAHGDRRRRHPVRRARALARGARLGAAQHGIAAAHLGGGRDGDRRPTGRATRSARCRRRCAGSSSSTPTGELRTVARRRPGLRRSRRASRRDRHRHPRHARGRADLRRAAGRLRRAAVGRAARRPRGRDRVGLQRQRVREVDRRRWSAP